MVNTGHLKQHGELAMKLGMPEKNVYIGEKIGDVIELTRDSIKRSASVVSDRYLLMVRCFGDVGNIVLRDRKHLSQDGILTVVVTIEKEKWSSNCWSLTLYLEVLSM